MKSLISLVFAMLVGISVGCGGGAVDPSAAAPASTPEQDMQSIEKAAESGEIDPSTYGK